MKKRFLSLALALLMCLSLLPVTASAVNYDLYDDYTNHYLGYNSYFELDGTGPYGWPVSPLTDKGDPEDRHTKTYVRWDKETEILSVSTTWVWLEFTDGATHQPQGTILMKADADGNYLKVEGVESRIVATKDWQNDDANSERCVTVDLKFYENGQPYEYGFGKYCVMLDIVADDEWHYYTLNDGFEFQTGEASDWAQPYVQQAEELGLIPEVLEGADMTQPINRLEFAAVSVKVYEALSGTAALPSITNPFTDTSDIEVLKAYNLGVTAGTSATTFSPTVLLNREQAATMLTRVFQRVTIPGWPENNPPLEYVKPAAFADDGDISDWAKDSVYFMAANGIIAGVGDNRFAPRATTTEQQAQGYAQATREQALTIAVRMVQNLGN